MKRVLAIVAAAILIFISPIVHSDDTKPLDFKLIQLGDMLDKQAAAAGFRTKIPSGVHLGFKVFEAQSGEKLWTHDGEFRTTEEANKYMNWKIHQHTAHELKEGNKLDDQGRVVGHRAEFWIKSDQNKKTWLVMWTETTNFYIVEAPTRESALEIAPEP